MIVLEYDLCDFQLNVRFYFCNFMCNASLLMAKFLHSDTLFINMLDWHLKRIEMLDCKIQLTNEFFMEVPNYLKSKVANDDLEKLKSRKENNIG